MHSFATSKNVKWCHLIWPTLYIMHIMPHNNGASLKTNFNYSSTPVFEMNSITFLHVDFTQSCTILVFGYVSSQHSYNAALNRTRIKRCTRSVRLSVCPSVPCVRFSRSWKAVETCNLVES